MVNIYIDDSGSRSLKDLDQPVYLLSAVCIDNKLFSDVSEGIQTIKDRMKNKIENTILSSFEKNTYTSNRSNKMSHLLTNLAIGDEFELHCSEIIRGDLPYIILDKDDRINTIKRVLRIVEKNGLTVLTVYCDKSQFTNRHGKDADCDNLMNKRMAEALLEMLNDYLEEKNEQSCIITDDGNFTVENYMIPILHKNPHERISSEIMEKKSNSSLNIQLADICAYTTNMKLMHNIKKDNYKHKKIAEELFGVIYNNTKMQRIL